MRLLLFIFLIGSSFAKEGYFLNPVISGAHPDPSICRVGDDYFIVNSSFEYFPGLPIHHSKDLVNWELIGYGLHRKEQCTGNMNLLDVQSDGGIHAPTIRYNKGVFYIITTNVYAPKDRAPGLMRNFVITAKDPKGPWSDPHIIDGAPGIDPDIFFDTNGKVYFTGTHSPGDNTSNGIGEIWVQELDIQNWELKGERKTVWDGVFGCCTEGPHLYKENGLYYLLVAEGGTGKNHAVMIAASENLFGPYTENPRNPILTSRHLTNDYFVNSTGHADMVQLKDGRWYMVALGKRNDLSGDSNMGRETFLAPVKWESAIVRWDQVSETKWEPVYYLWPVVSPLSGRIERFEKLPFEDKRQYLTSSFHEDFQHDKMNLRWTSIRVPNDNSYSLTDNKGHLRLYSHPNVIENRKRFNFLGFRQTESDFTYQVKMSFHPSNSNTEAGIALYQKEYNFLKITIKKDKNKNSLTIMMAAKDNGLKQIYKGNIKEYENEIIFKIESKDDNYNFLYSLDDGNSFIDYFSTKAGPMLSRNYTGALLGVFVSSNGKKNEDYADYDWVRYNSYPR